MERTGQKTEGGLLDIFCNFLYYLTLKAALSRPVFTQEKFNHLFYIFNILLNEFFRVGVTQTLNCFYHFVFS